MSSKKDNVSAVLALEQENQKLHQINQRLEQQLRECLNRLGPEIQQIFLARTQFLPIDKVNKNIDLSLIGYGYIDTLFESYDYQIMTLQSTVNELKQKLDKLQEKVKLVSNENFNLREKVQEQANFIKEYIDNQSRYGVNNNSSSSNNEFDYSEYILSLEKENQYISGKYREQTIELQRIKDILIEKDQQTDEALRKYIEINDKYTIKEVEYDDIKNKMENYKYNVKALEGDVEALAGQNSELETKLTRRDEETRLLRYQLTQLKSSYEDTEERRMNELSIQQRENEQNQKKLREQMKKVFELESQVEDIQDKCRRIERENELYKRDQEQMLKMIENYEMKVQNSSKREETMNDLIKNKKREVDEAILVRDKIIIKEEETRKLLEQTNLDMKEKIYEIQTHYEKIIENVKLLSKKRYDDLINDYKLVKEQNVKINLRNEKLEKENYSLNEEMKRFENGIGKKAEEDENQFEEMARRLREKEENGLFEMTNINERLRRATEEKEDLIREFERVKKEMKELKLQYNKLNSKFNEIQTQNQDLMYQNDQLKNDNKLLQGYKYSADVTIQDAVQSKTEQYTDNIQILEQQLQEAFQREKITREKSTKLIQQHEDLEQKLKQEVKKTIQYYEKCIQDLKLENKMLVSRVKELQDFSNQRKT